MRRADRLMKLVHYLRKRRRAVTSRQIAEDFGVCQRTIYRDIQDLMDSGVPIYGEAGVGYIIDKKYHLPPVMFDQDELEALSLGIAMVRNWTDEGYARKAEEALDKISAVLPENLLHELEQLTVLSMPSQGKIPWEVDFSRIRECIRNKQKISFKYRDEQRKTSERTVRPLALVFFGPVWLMVAWCEWREDFRNFRLDRMRQMEVSDDLFRDERGKTLAAYCAIQDGA